MQRVIVIGKIERIDKNYFEMALNNILFGCLVKTVRIIHTKKVNIKSGMNIVVYIDIIYVSGNLLLGSLESIKSIKSVDSYNWLDCGGLRLW